LIGVGGGLSIYSVSYFSDFRIHAVAIATLFGALALILGLVKKSDVVKVLKGS
jgi:hypothetical protein